MRPKINTNKFCKLLTKSMLVIKIKINGYLGMMMGLLSFVLHTFLIGGIYASLIMINI